MDTLQIGDWAVGRLHDELLVGAESDHFVDAALQGAHGRGRGHGQSEDRQEDCREAHFSIYIVQMAEKKSEGCA